MSTWLVPSELQRAASIAFQKNSERPLYDGVLANWVVRHTQFAGIVVGREMGLLVISTLNLLLLHFYLVMTIHGSRCYNTLKF